MPDQLNSIAEKLKTFMGISPDPDANDEAKHLFDRDKQLGYINKCLLGAAYLIASSTNLMASLGGIPVIGSVIGPAFNFMTIAFPPAAIISLGIMLIGSALACAFQFNSKNNSLIKEGYNTNLQSHMVTENKDNNKNQLKAALAMGLAMLIGVAVIPIPIVGPLVCLGLMAYGISKYATTSLQSYGLAKYTASKPKNSMDVEELESQCKFLRKTQSELRTGATATFVLTTLFVLVAVGVISFPPAIPAIFLVGMAISMGSMLITQGITMYKNHSEIQQNTRMIQQNRSNIQQNTIGIQHKIGKITNPPNLSNQTPGIGGRYERRQETRADTGHNTTWATGGGGPTSDPTQNSRPSDLTRVGGKGGDNGFKPS